MKKIMDIALTAILVVLLSCKNQQKKNLLDIDNQRIIKKLEIISDSIQVGQIVVKNLFKNQILAHGENEFDSMMIIEKVYKPHKALWDDCFGIIYGEGYANSFSTEEGMIGWNRTLYPENRNFFNSRAEELLAINIDATLNTTLARFNELVPFEVSATIGILFSPMPRILFGGCDNDRFCIELNYRDQEIKYTIEKGLPHELNHLAYNPLRKYDLHINTALSQTIDEGFACYFTWKFFDGKIFKYEAVENMSETDWNWYLKNEKSIFDLAGIYFNDESNHNPFLKNDKHQQIPNAPKSLHYWLGFRIIEKYVENNGIGSWRDIYHLPAQEVFDKSGYQEYIDGLEQVLSPTSAIKNMKNLN